MPQAFIAPPTGVGGPLQNAPSFRVTPALEKGSREPLTKRFALFALYLALLAVTLGISWHDGGFHSESGGHPDEAAHYVTGLMFRDYFLSLDYFSPIQFAENFYMHYPKVAIGHWPPVMYAIEGVWTILFSTSRGSLMLLMAALTALLGFIVYQMLKTQFGRPLAFAAALSAISLPLVQDHTTLIMADIPLTIFSLLAAISFGRYLETPEFKSALWFGSFASLAILTKGNGVALALLPPIAILLSRKWNLLRKLSLWSSAALVLAVCGPWFWVTRHMQNGSWVQPTLTLSYTVSAVKFFSFHFFTILGLPLAILALLGLGTFFYPSFSFEGKGFWAAMTGLMLGFFIVASAMPVGTAERYLLPAIPAALAFAVAGMRFVGLKLPESPSKPALLSSIFLLVFLLTPFRFRKEPNYGFAPIAQMLTSSPQFRNDVILIASDANGEGMLISEVAIREQRPGHVVLRAGKMLTRSDWIGNYVTPVFQTTKELQNYLDSIPVSVVILDHSVSPPDFRDYESLLEQVIASHENTWKLFGVYSIWRRGLEYRNAVQVFARSAPVGGTPGVIRIDMTNMLGRSLTLQLDPAHLDGEK